MLRERPLAIVRSPEQITGEWIGAALGTCPVAEVTVEAIGTGQMSDSYRVAIAYGNGAEGPASVVVKIASEDATSRGTGQNLGIYSREVQFYLQLAPRIGGPTARCHAAAIDDRGCYFTLVLADVADAVQGDQIEGCDVADAELAMRALAELHAPVYGDATLGAAPWLNRESPLTQALVAQLLPAFLERYDGRIAAEHVEVCERLVPSLDGWTADARPPLGLVHGDYRLDNMLFTSAPKRALTVVDWQTVSWGPMLLDAAYFLGGCLPLPDRREHERELLGSYHRAMLAGGASDLRFEDCWEGYRGRCLYGVLMSIVAPMIVLRTDRGDDMFMTMIARYAQQALDLDALELLPAPGSGRPAPLAPAPRDEGRHEPASEQLWNESWYFDAVDRDGELGAYVRLGLYPNLGVAWYTALVCGPGRETVAAVDFRAPLPGEGSLTVSRDGLHAEHACERPLELFRVRLDADAESVEDPAALLRGEHGEPVRLALDLSWETRGTPYAYRLTTRYEIPCAVSGTIRIGDEQLRLEGPGQRDHSWGTRDWWSMDWMWSAAALDDGTRVHAVALRIPEAPPLGVGYVQDGDGALTELDAVQAQEQVAPDGLIESAQISVAGLPELAVRPLAFAPLRLEAPDGRVSHFPRAMCAFEAADGRRGLGWVEWNLNQPA